MKAMAGQAWEREKILFDGSGWIDILVINERQARIINKFCPVSRPIVWRPIFKWGKILPPESEAANRRGAKIIHETKPIGTIIDGIELCEPPFSKAGYKRKAVFNCHCGKQFVGEYARWMRNILKSCGCKKGFKLDQEIKVHKIGHKINGIELLSDIFQNYNRQRCAKFKCHCGKEFETRYHHWHSEKIKGCGCTRGRSISEALLKRGRK